MLYAFNNPSVQRFRLRYVYLRSARERVWEVSVHQVERFAVEMETTAQAMDLVDTPTPRAGQLCDYCEVAPDCPRVLDQRVAVLSCPEVAARAAQGLRAAKGAVQCLESRLRAYTEQNGPITLPDGSVCGHHPKQTTVWPSTEVVGWLAANTDLTDDQILREFRINKTRLTRLARAAGLRKPQRAELNGLSMIMPGTSFGFKKGAPKIETDVARNPELRGDSPGQDGSVEGTAAPDPW